MKTTTAPEQAPSSAHILEAFEQLTAREKARAAQIQTRADEAAREEDAVIVERAKAYSVEGIVKGLAELQLSFSDELDTLAKTLTQEADKLHELERAIRVETAHSQQLHDIRVAAEAVNILDKQQRDQLLATEEHIASLRIELSQEQAQTRQQWARQEQEHEQTMALNIAKRDQARALEADEFNYATKTARQKELDQFELERTKTLRELEATDAQRSLDWAKRTQALDERAQEIDALRLEVEAMPTTIEEAVKEAREAAIKRERQNAKVEAELLAKEMDNDAQVYELQMRTLQDKIESQAQQLRELIAQLNAASNQTQSLAAKAIEGSQHRQSA